MTPRPYFINNQHMPLKNAQNRIGANQISWLKDLPGSVWTDWRWQKRHLFRKSEDLLGLVPAFGNRLVDCGNILETFPALVTPYFLSLADPNDPHDPIAAQFLPSKAEWDTLLFGEDDPLDEEGQSPVPGLIHRYPDRVLLVATNMCFVHCRHCNRKRFWRQPDKSLSGQEMARILEYLELNAQIREVVISGGDPLTLSNEKLDEMLTGLRSVRHIEAVRIGTRAPAACPFRIDRELADILKKHAPVWINTHFNHPREVTPEAGDACRRLLRAGAPVNNQTVLLRGINDNARIMTELCHALQKIGVRPYYLFQCDTVRGVEHFRTPLNKGIEIIDLMRGHTSGLCIPTLALDTPGGGGKITLQPEYLLTKDACSFMLRNHEGKLFHYRDPEI